MASPSPGFTVTTQDVTHWAYITSGPAATAWWAEVDGVCVAYMKTHTHPDEDHCGARFVLCDIEVRDGHRGQGLVGSLIEHAQDATGLVLHTSGNYTPLGAAAMQGKIPVLPGRERDEGVAFGDMTFVRDWDAKRGPS